MRNGLNSQFLFYFITLLVMILHCYTLDLFPLPWFDEIHFAGISKSLADDGNLASHFLSFTKGNTNSLSYGPVFFAIQSSFIKLFGFNIHSIRLSTLIFGIANVIIVYVIGLRITNSKITSSFVGICFSMDLFYSTILHEGRMETFISLLFLSSVLLIQSKSINDYIKVGLVSLLCVLSFSTSPRSFILIIPLIAYLLYNIPKNHMIMGLLFFSIFFFVYSFWLFFAFDSLSHWFYHYLAVIKGNKTAIYGYLGGNFYIPKSQYLLIITTLILTFVNRKLIKQPLVFLFLGNLLMFYSLVHDWGNYSSLVIPLYYLLIILLLNNISSKKSRMLFITPLLLFNMFYFSIKMISTVLEREHRSIDTVSVNLSKIITPGDKVIGDDIMVYIAEENKWNFQVFTHYKDLEEREVSLRKRFHYDFLLVSQGAYSKNKDDVDYFIQKGGLKLIDHFDYPPHSINSFLSKVGLSTMEKRGYSYFLYAR